MNKKILIPLVIIFIALGLVFLVTVRTSEPEQTLEETLSALRDEIRLIHEEAWEGQISQGEADVRLAALENRLAGLIARHGLQAEADEFVARRKTAEELAKQTELRIMTIELQLAGIAEKDAGLAMPLIQELSGVRNEIYAGQISREKAEEKLSVFENKLAELIVQHGIEDEAGKFVARYETAKELTQQFEPRIRVLDLQLGGIAEYFAQKHKIDTGEEVVQARTLQVELMDLSDEIWEGKVSQEEIDEKLSFFENKTAELIKEYGIETEIDDFAERIDGSVDRVTEISQRISDIQLKLTALELYLSDNF